MGSISSGRGSVVFDLRGAQDFKELHEDPGAGGPRQHRARRRARTQDDGVEPEVSIGDENLTQVSISLEVAGFLPFQMPGVEVAHARVPAQIDLGLPDDDTAHVRWSLFPRSEITRPAVAVVHRLTSSPAASIPSVQFLMIPPTAFNLNASSGAGPHDSRLRDVSGGTSGSGATLRRQAYSPYSKVFHIVEKQSPQRWREASSWVLVILHPGPAQGRASRQGALLGGGAKAAVENDRKATTSRWRFNCRLPVSVEPRLVAVRHGWVSVSHGHLFLG